MFWDSNASWNYGRRAEKADIGVVVGARKFEFITHSSDANVWQKDQVVNVPPAASITASAAYRPVGGLEHGFPTASVQFHPEYSEYQLSEIFSRSGENFLISEQIDNAIENFARSNLRNDLMSREVATFYRKYLC